MSAELNDLIRSVATEHPDAQPDELATLIAKATPPKKVKEFYIELLVPKINSIFANERNNAIRSVSAPTKDRKKKPAATRAKTRPSNKKPTSSPTNISAKITARRAEKWEKVFEQNVQVNGKSVLVGDLTATDCDWIRADHNKRADQIVAFGDIYGAWGDAILEYGVEHFRDLPDEALEALEAA